jgi:hypothetical protein
MPSYTEIGDITVPKSCYVKDGEKKTSARKIGTLFRDEAGKIWGIMDPLALNPMVVNESRVAMREYSGQPPKAGDVRITVMAPRGTQAKAPEQPAAEEFDGDEMPF